MIYSALGFFPYTLQRSLMILQVTTSSWSWAGFGILSCPLEGTNVTTGEAKVLKKCLKKHFFNSVKTRF